jgi:Spy/CpxP family protein refolding chaperone
MKSLASVLAGTVVTASLALGLAGTAFAQPGSPGPMPVPGIEGMRRLNLSTEQQAQLRDLGRESQANMKRIGDAMRKARQELEEVYSQPKLDTRRAKQLNNQINALQKDMLEEHLRVEQRLRAILTPEQFTTLRSEMTERWKGRFPRTRVRPPGDDKP